MNAFFLLCFVFKLVMASIRFSYYAFYSIHSIKVSYYVFHASCWFLFNQVMASYYVLVMQVDGNEVKRTFQKNPETFTNVECYAGGKEKKSINGLVRNLKYIQRRVEFSKIILFLSITTLTTSCILEPILQMK